MYLRLQNLRLCNQTPPYPWKATVLLSTDQLERK